MYKYKIIILICMVIVVFIISCFICNAKELPLKNKIIYIDPGHGGNDPGANYKDIKESDINLKISLKLAKLLEENGALVYMTRYDDYNLANIDSYNIKRSDLNNRIKIINNSNCDMFLSIHLNAYTSSTWYGAQTFYTNNNKDNIVLAEIIQKNFKKNLNTNRNIKNINNRYLYDNLDKLGVLLEVGFITNPNERNLLVQDSYQYRITNSILESVIEYFNK